MTQLEIFLLIGLFSSFFATGVIFFSHKKQAAQVLDETHRTHNELYGKARRIISKLEGQLMASQKAFNDQLITLQKANDKLSTEKTTVLQQYHSTETLLNMANKKNKELLQEQETQNMKNGDELHQKQQAITKSNQAIRELELQLNQVIGHYQAEKQRNLLAEHAHISDSLAKLSTLEKQLAALGTAA